jgi:hypothetical protein
VTDEDGPATPPPDATEKTAHDRRTNRLAWAIALGVIAVVVGCSVLVSVGKDSGTSRGDEVGARKACEEFVGRRLKAPSTAEFSGTTVTGGPVTFTVAGSVDAENSFGAKIRNSYICKVSDAAGDSWSLVSLSGLDGLDG